MITVFAQKKEGKRYRLCNKRELFVEKNIKPSEDEIIGYIKIKDLKKQNYCSDDLIRQMADEKEEKYLFSFYEKDYIIDENKTEKIKGYVKLNYCNKNLYIAITSNSIFPMGVIFLFSSFKAMFAVVLATGLTVAGVTAINKTPSNKAPIKIADTKDYNDEPIDIDAQEDNVEENGEIALNQYSYHYLRNGETLPLTNISSNDVNLQYNIINASTGDVIYSSGLIEPGKKEEWNAAKYLQPGKNQVIISITPYTQENEECVGSNMSAVIEIQQ